MTATTETTKRTAEQAYIDAYNRAMKALREVDAMIHGNPAPYSEIKIHWGNVGDMARIATALEEILPEE